MKFFPCCFALALSTPEGGIVESWTLEAHGIVHRRTVIDDDCQEFKMFDLETVVSRDEAKAAWRALRRAGYKSVRGTVR